MPKLPLDADPIVLHEFEQVAIYFRQISLGSTIRAVGINSVPSEALKYFERQSGRFMAPEEYTPFDFHVLFEITHFAPYLSHVAWKTVYHHSGGIETNMFVSDIDPKNQESLLGSGVLRYDFGNQDQFFRLKPFVDYTHTQPPHQRRGLALARLVTMNALSQAFLGLPLYSGSSFHTITEQKPSEGPWLRLVELGLAERTPHDPNYRRYRFLPFRSNRDLYYKLANEFSIRFGKSN